MPSPLLPKPHRASTNQATTLTVCSCVSTNQPVLPLARARTARCEHGAIVKQRRKGRSPVCTLERTLIIGQQQHCAVGGGGIANPCVASCKHTDTHRHTQTHTDTHRHTQTNTDTHRHTQTHPFNAPCTPTADGCCLGIGPTVSGLPKEVDQEEDEWGKGRDTQS